MNVTSEQTNQPEAVDVVRADDYKHLNSPGSYPLREAPWSHARHETVNPDSFRFGVSAARFQEVLSHALFGLVDPESQLRGLLAATFDFAESEPQAFESILTMHHAELTRGTANLTPLDVFKQVVHDGMHGGVFWRSDPALAAAWVVALVQRSAVLAHSRRFEGTRSEIRALAIDAAVRLMKARLDYDASLDPWAASDQRTGLHPSDEGAEDEK